MGKFKEKKSVTITKKRSRVYRSTYKIMLDMKTENQKLF